MNRGGGGEHQFLMRQRRSGDCVRRAHVVASSKRWLLPSACPGFLPTAAQPSCNFVFHILKI